MNRSCRYGTSPLKFEICSGIAGPHIPMMLAHAPEVGEAE